MKLCASYSRRFKLNFKQKNDFLKNLHWCCPLSNYYNYPRYDLFVTILEKRG